MPADVQLPEATRLTIRNALIELAKNAPIMTAAQRRKALEALAAFVKNALEAQDELEAAAAAHRARSRSSTSSAREPAEPVCPVHGVACPDGPLFRKP